MIRPGRSLESVGSGYLVEFKSALLISEMVDVDPSIAIRSR
jgi:hypothetical protein